MFCRPARPCVADAALTRTRCIAVLVWERDNIVTQREPPYKELVGLDSLTLCPCPDAEASTRVRYESAGEW